LQTLPALEPGFRTARLALVFQADPASVRQALEGMLVCPPLSELSDDDRGTAELVLAEILNNVAEHAYCEVGGRVEVILEPDPAGLRCLILDWGHEMPGGRLPEGRLPGGPDLALDELPEGGFGWHLIRSLCADLAYTRAQGQNRLSFVLASGS
jgi:serine/threonine-protein kinase RsbW